MDTRRAPKRIFDAHPPDQNAQLRLDLRSPSQWARLPTPVAAKAGPVPTHERLGPDDSEILQDRRKPAIQLDKEPAIIVREPDATMQPTLQDNQLMSKHRLLSFKPQLRLEWRGQDETEQPDHSASLGDSTTSSTQIRFSVHTPASFRSAFGRLRFHQVRSLSSLFLKGFRRFVAGGFQPIAGFRMLSDYVSYISRVFSGDLVAFGGPSVEEPEAGQIR